ncbi:MAG: xanthine dehydrogenase family protein molybdopterin-binding subunit [Defluviitaleaceae bacterium]|nr:xanthine dehydrogenase family protein molybdopterin-binding subunit [Defluviitaleaceae bacterium]
MSYIGKSIKRHDGVQKVTGRAEYVSDIKLNGMLHAKILTSPHAHAKIVNINTEKAKALPGVRTVLTGQEENTLVGIYMVDRSALASGKVRHWGEAVAAVAADTEEIAEQAVKLIEVEYEVLPIVFDVKEAIKPGAPQIHENAEEYDYIKGVFHPEPGRNIANRTKVRRGDVEAAFARADVVIERTYEQPQVFHLPLEPHGSIVQWGVDDNVKIYSSTQSPFAVRDLFAHGFGLPRNKVEVIAPYVGGGFGVKSGIHMEPLVGMLSKRCGGRPVKFIPTREEECTTLPARQGMVSRIKTGATKDGKIIAEEAEYLWVGGAYADYGVNISRAGAMTGCGPYDIENVKVDSVTVYTNHVFGTAYRGFGHPEVFHGIERQRDLLAKELGMCPVELRLKNLLMPGRKTITGELITENTGRVDKCLKLVSDKLKVGEGYTSQQLAEMKKTGKYRGKAATVLQKSPAMPTSSASSAIIHMNEDGTVHINVGGVDFGQGTYTVLQQIAAERLRIPIEKISVAPGVNTDMSPYDWQTVASRMTVLCGEAVCIACDDVTRQLLEMGAIALRASKHDLALEDEHVYVKQNPHQRVHYSKICMGYTYENGNAIGGPIIGRGKYIAQGLSFICPETGQGKTALDWTYGAHAVEVEVDTNTGDIEVLQMASCLDVGRVMNEAMLKGQVVGGVLQGLGTALSEVVRYDDKGRPLTRNLTDYKIPTFKDMPGNLDVSYVETPQLDGPYGARGVGEHPLISITAVIANALANATGVEMFDLPLSADKVRAALRQAK